MSVKTTSKSVIKHLLTESKTDKKPKKQKKHPGGRPTVITEKVLQKLEDAFAIGSSDREACLMADISPATLYEYQKIHPEFIERKAQLKEMPKYKARATVNKFLSTDPDIAKWYLERKAKDEFSTRVENTGAEGKPLNVSVINYDNKQPKAKE